MINIANIGSNMLAVALTIGSKRRGTMYTPMNDPMPRRRLITKKYEK
jgi:hypothetical protein